MLVVFLKKIVFDSIFIKTHDEMYEYAKYAENLEICNFMRSKISFTEFCHFQMIFYVT